MPITFKKKAEPEPEVKKTITVGKTKAAPEAAPEKEEAVSKAKLKGTAKANVKVEKVDNKTKEATTLVSEQEDTDIEQASAVNAQKPVVGYSFGFTMKAGEFQSYRASVWLSMPVEETDLNEGFDLIKEWVDTKVQAIAEELQQDGE